MFSITQGTERIRLTERNSKNLFKEVFKLCLLVYKYKLLNIEILRLLIHWVSNKLDYKLHTAFCITRAVLRCNISCWWKDFNQDKLHFTTYPLWNQQLTYKYPLWVNFPIGLSKWHLIFVNYGDRIVIKYNQKIYKVASYSTEYWPSAVSCFNKWLLSSHRK